MACYPGTPCNPVPVGAVYPKKCNNGWFAGYPIQTNLICYNGPNLPNTGVNTGNNMNLVLEKIDLYLTPETLVQTLLQTIQSNPSLNVSFCTLVNACVENTTTTTTSSSTTTTTTTAVPFIAAGALGSPSGIDPFASSGDACSAMSVSSTNFYTPNGVTIAGGVQLSQGDVFLGFAAGWYIYTYYDGNPISPRQVFELDSNSTVISLITCP